MGNVGQSMSVQPLLPIGENTLGKEKMQIHILIHKYKLSLAFTIYNTDCAILEIHDEVAYRYR